MVSAKQVALQRELSDLKAECAALKAERTTNEKMADVLAHSEQLKAERDAVIAELFDTKAERDTLKAATQLVNTAHCDCCKTAQTHLVDLCEAAQATLDPPCLRDASPEALLDGYDEMKTRRDNLRKLLAQINPALRH